MLSDDLARYVALHEALGFRFRTQRILLRLFVVHAERRGDEWIKGDRVIEWAIEAPSPEQRRNRLLTVRRFAIAMHAENSRNDVPAADALGRGLFRRTQPYIYSASEITRLMTAATSLGPVGTIRPLAYVTLFGLLAATGLRISEALALRLSDVGEDGRVLQHMWKGSEHDQLTMWRSCARDGGGPLEIGFQERVSNQSKLLHPKGVVVSVGSKVGRYPAGEHPRDECK